MTQSSTRAIARTLFVATLAAATASALLVVLALPGPEPSGTFGFPGFSTVYALAFGTVGVLIATRRPENPIGWMMLVSGGLLGALQQVAQQYGAYTLLADGTLPGGEIGAWVQDWIWLPQFCTLGLALLLVPHGRLPSPRWRAVVWTIVVATAVATIARLLRPGPIESFREAGNPFGLTGAGDALEVIYAIAFAVSLGPVVATAVSLAQRRRRAVGEERAQVRWVAFGGVITTVVFVAYGIVYGILNTGPAVDALEVAFVISVFGLAGAFGIAILRFRLFDIDVVVSKTVVFGLLAAFFTAVYVAVVVGIGAIVGSGGNAVLSAVAAAMVALAFQPVRRRAQHVANRIVYGRRASPYEVLSEFSQRVDGAYGAEDVPARMARILGEGIGAGRADVWLRVGPRLELAASWPDEEHRAEPVGVRDDDVPELPGAGAAVAVRHEGGLLGALAVTKPPSEPLTPTEERVVADLAHQAGLVLRNAALIADLRASRQRLVAAQDEERRRLERNLHDGAQQQLVALSVKLGLLRRNVGEDPQRLQGLIDELQAESQDALENLRDLARGDLPAGAGGPGARRGARVAGAQGPVPGRDRGRGARTLPPAGRGGRVLLVPRGAAERGEVREGVERDRADGRDGRHPDVRILRRRRRLRRRRVGRRDRPSGHPRPALGTRRHARDPVGPGQGHDPHRPGLNRRLTMDPELASSRAPRPLPTVGDRSRRT